MSTKYSHKSATILSCFFLLVFALDLSCASNKSQAPVQRKSTAISISPDAININTADANELQKIPGIGLVSAKKIIDHRARYGPFRRPEEILIIDGISEKRLREFRSYILIE